MGKKGIPSFRIKVVRGDEIIPWDDIPKEEQIQLSRKWNLQAAQAVAHRHGYVIAARQPKKNIM